ncbi:NAD-dependent epimerase/dehydratase family protein [Salinicola acroporae]|uniref:NAD-dependent epimerase/dehydratase family protein n=1 Tax=Salinicola acroporae TaxID=1541440 RepID=UPI0024589677|nr:NAD-dependent epimerase/dehydratase family protein [Salinicola acroporae]
MRVFVTGATGFIGSMVVRELIAAGHSVLGMTRSEAGASNLRSIGVTPLIGTIEDDELLKRAAESADGVIHLAFNHDFTRYVQNCEDDRRVIATLGNALVGSERPLIVTSGVGGLPSTPEHLPTEDDIPPSVADFPRAASEEAAKAAMARASIHRSYDCLRFTILPGRA